MRQLAKQIFNKSGVLHLCRRRNRRAIRILLYHRFPAPWRENLERHCAHLASKYTILSMTALEQSIRERRQVPDNAVVFTVDDGYRDFYQVAYPIFRKYNIPVLFYLTTGYMDRECWLWGDRLRYCFRNTPHQTFRAVGMEFSKNQQAAGLERLREMAKAAPDAERRRIVAEFESASGIQVPERITADYEPCTRDEIREMARGGIEFGAHTLTHPILSKLPDAATVEREILGSKARLEAELGQPVTHFAYPNGRWQDVNQAALATARRHFTTATMALEGLNSPETDIHALLRLPFDPDHPIDAFERRLAGFRVAQSTAPPGWPA
ncbi:MAG: polysaccharide deacetylase family protein [Acidobacteria bacterium]|nr:polysaccharide deacetylase family protein [Acidobacteriota bacterium]